MGNKTIYSLRIFMFATTLVVLGLSISIDQWWAALQAGCEASSVCNKHWYTSRTIAWRFANFTGVFSNLASGLGMASLHFDRIPFMLVLVVDALAALMLVGGGVTLSFMYGNGVCSASGMYADHCKSVPADLAMMYIGFVATMLCLVYGVLSRSKAAAMKAARGPEKGTRQVGLGAYV